MTVDTIIFSKAKTPKKPLNLDAMVSIFCLNSTTAGAVPKMNSKQKNGGQRENYHCQK